MQGATGGGSGDGGIAVGELIAAGGEKNVAGAQGAAIKLVATEGARYTVPNTIRPDKMEDLLTVRFRVGDVYKDSFVSVYFDDERILHNKKRILSPGEMEQIVLRKAQLAEYPDLKTITVKIEKE